MVDWSGLIMDNLLYILITVIIAIGIVVSIVIHRSKKSKSALQATPVIAKPDIELTKTYLPGKTGTITKGRLSSLDNQETSSDEQVSKREKLKENW